MRVWGTGRNLARSCRRMITKMAIKDYSTYPLPHELEALAQCVHDNLGCLVAQDEGEEPEPNGQILERELPDLQPSMHNKGY